MTFTFSLRRALKTRFIDANPEVCLQVEEVTDSTHWRSVMVTGKAEHITSNEDMQNAMSLITERNPSLTPAISATSVDAWGRAVTSRFIALHLRLSMDERLSRPAL